MQEAIIISNMIFFIINNYPIQKETVQ